MSENKISNFKSNILDWFELYESRMNGQKITPIHQIRSKALNIFKENGLPTLKMEDWKYTNVAFLNKYDFNISSDLPKAIYSKQDIESYLIPNLDCDYVVCIDGFYHEELSKIDDEKIKRNLKSIKSMVDNKSEDFLLHYSKYLNFEKHPFVALNTAMSLDGLFLEIPKSCIISKPLHIINITTCTNDNVINQSRNLIILRENSQAEIIETNVTIGNNTSFNNFANEIILEQNANLIHYKLQNDSINSIYIGSTQVEQAKNSNYRNFTVTLNGSFVRNDLNSVLNGEASNADFIGLFIANGSRFVDNHTFVNHAVPNCTSNETYKGILNDKSTGVFNGKILVMRDAQKTNAYQSSKSLILSDEARMNSKPELEIYADDVKCSHGASTGALDPDSIFYLRARGIDENQAKKMLQEAFASQIINEIKIEAIRNYLNEIIHNKLEK